MNEKLEGVVIHEEIISAAVAAPFDEAVKTLRLNGYGLISLMQLAQLRMQKGRNSIVSSEMNYTREGALYIPKRGGFLVRESPIINFCEEATQADRAQNEFYLSAQCQIDQALLDSVILPKSKTDIPTRRLGENEIGVWAFKDQAKSYGEFLSDAGVLKFPVFVVDKEFVYEQGQAFVKQVIFGTIYDDGVCDGISCEGSSLHWGNPVRGIKKRKVQGIK